MRSSLSRVAATIVVGVIVIGCASAASPAPSTNPAPSASPTSAPSASASPPRATTRPSVTPSVKPPPVAPAWHATGNMVSPHAFHTATLLRDGRVLVAGGVINDRLDGQVLASAELYDSTTGSWTATGNMVSRRWGHTATLLPDGKVLVAGSYVNSSVPLASAELYDPGTGLWTATEDMTAGRGGHTATLLPNGKVLLVGGGEEDTLLEGRPRSSTAELYDPDTEEWSAIRSMTEARVGHSATLLQDGSVLAVGGSGNLIETELYDPSTGRWTATGSTSAPQGFGHTATLLRDGRVLGAGGNPGSDWDPHTTAELYDPGTARWTTTSSMAKPRSGHTATLMSDDRVLMVGGAIYGDAPTTAELYDPGSDQWTDTASPAEDRFAFTATLLADDRVLLTGDYKDNSQASAELYEPGNGP